MGEMADWDFDEGFFDDEPWDEISAAISSFQSGDATHPIANASPTNKMATKWTTTMTDFTKEIETYRDLLRILQTLTPDQLDQPVQLVPVEYSHKGVTRLQPVICIATIGDVDVESRSSFDYTHRPDHIVLLADRHPFSADGAIAQDLFTGDPVYPTVDLAAKYDRERAERAQAR